MPILSNTGHKYAWIQMKINRAGSANHQAQLGQNLAEELSLTKAQLGSALQPWLECLVSQA